MNELLAALLIWTSTVLGVTPPEAPAVLIVAPLEVGPAIGGLPIALIRAGYDRPTRKIVVSAEDCAGLSRTCQAILVHELVHHILYVTGSAPDCHGAEERIAYTISYRWVLEKAPEVMANVVIDPIAFIFTTSCELSP